MIPLDSESGLWLLASIPKLEVILDEAINYLPTAGFFLVGIWIGYLFFGRKKTVPDAPGVPATSDQREVSEMENALVAARNRGEQQEGELAAIRNQAALAGRQLEERERRVEGIFRILESALIPSGEPAGVVRVSAPVIRLADTIQTERHRIEGGIARAQHLKRRLEFHQTELAGCAEEIAKARSQLKENTETAARPILGQVGKIDECLRVLRQNVSGCLQRLSGADAHLQSEHEKLVDAGNLCGEIELGLTSGNFSGPDALRDAAESAQEKLSGVRGSIASLTNGIDQEIAEMTGRIDWVVEATPQKLLKAFEDLKADELSGDSAIADLLRATGARVEGIKGSLEATHLALQSEAVLETCPEGCGKRRLEEGLDRVVAELKAVEESPEAGRPEAPEIEGTLAHLQRQLALREAETARLHGEVKSRDEELEKLRSTLEKRKRKADDRSARGLQPAGTGPGFVRRLLGLGPSRERPVQAEVQTAPAATLAEARAILDELKVSSSSGNGGTPSPPAAAEKSSGPRQKSAAATSPVISAPESTAELGRLQGRLSAQQARIRDLEQEIAALRMAPAPDRSESLPAKEPAEEAAPLSGVQSGDSIEPKDEVLLFRGSDLAAWDTAPSGSGDGMATPLEQVSDTIQYLRMRRLDTGDSVVMPITRDELIAGASATGKGFGWSGKRERYFGGYHFGIYDESVPREVETKFGVGGWGFGHRASIDSEQAFGWAGKRIDPTDFEISVGGGLFSPPEQVATGDIKTETSEPAPEPEPEAVVSETGLVIFRSKDPEIWNQTVYQGANHRARAIEELPADICWLRIRRLPDENSIIVPITKAGLTNDGEGLTYGFNGSNEIFYGARHLGAFAENLPQEVETRFTYGGWGFGHRPAGVEEQACAWEGKEAPCDSVFEITVFRQKPDIYEPFDRVLGDSS